MCKVWITVPIRWGDMDAFGHVNNAAYFSYCESARIRYFEEVGIDTRRPEGEGPIVVRATCNFRRQLRYPEVLQVGARVSDIGDSSFTIDYGMFLKDQSERVADGRSVAVWMNYSKGSSVTLPKSLRVSIREVESD